MWMHHCNRSMRLLSNRWVCFAFLLCLLQTSTLYDLMISYVFLCHITIISELLIDYSILIS